MRGLTSLILMLMLAVLIILPGTNVSSNELQRFYNFKAIPAERLLGPKLFPRYQDLLKVEDCEAATVLLNRQFVARYPEFSDTVKKPGAYNRSYDVWLTVLVARRYPELAMCISQKKFTEIESRIKKEGAKVGRYFDGKGVQTPSLYEPESLWSDRDWAIHSFVVLAQENYAPAYITLARLARRGDVFSFSADVEYYFIQRACHLGIDCAPHRLRLKALRAQLGKQTVAAMDKLAIRKRHMIHDIFPDQ